MGMLEQLVITLREGVEAALIVAIALAYLRKIGRADLIRTVYAALLAAVGVSLAGAIALTLGHWNEDRFEGWLMLVAAVFVFTMVYWMHRTARFLRQEIEQRIDKLRGASAWGLFLFIFFMVLREGVETVLMLSAVSFNSSELLAWMGSVLGLLLAVGFAVAFVRGSMRIHLPRFFRITTVILLVIGAQLLLTGTHELMEAGVLPSSPREMAIVGPIVANDVFFFVVILGLAGLLILFDRGQVQEAVQAQAVAAGGGETLTAAERRKQISAARSNRRWMTLAYSGAFLFMVLISADYVYARSARALTPAVTVVAQAGWVSLPVAEVADGSLHRYQAVTPAGPVRFFAIRRPDGTIAVALDACQICGSQGYYQHGGQLFCRNCDAPINIASVGTFGGCNPIPLQAVQRGGVIAISLALLAQAAPRFRP
ncbi:MAG TPA: Fe-S-containing protein [Terriglobales bacterium]|nr:Fe-S-containing protein [Terriglobales bacterium]